jgi:DNA-binding transcriptional LysR family regulator
MPRRLPPLNALRSFEAAARYESFTRAAEELHVTQSAVSQQVKALETELGVKLFGRERQRLKITPAGRDYLIVIREALDHIGAGTERLMSGRTPASSRSAPRWISPRNGWCIAWLALPRHIPASICGFRRRCIP